jgi:2-polyprenyl-3-methyl-5-hydroxy-6-metoxy-1,4-benzoquinol methylase
MEFHFAAQQRMAILANYYQWILALHAVQMGTPVLDIGCGIGNATEVLLRNSPHDIIACDRDPESLRALEARVGSSSRLKTICCDIESDIMLKKCEGSYNSILLLDVLEHVEDDIGLLTRIRKLAKVGGTLFVKVPSCPRLFCEMDAASGHVRRYTRERLLNVLCQSGWSIISATSMNVIGAAAYWLRKRSQTAGRNFSLTFSVRQLRWINKLVPCVRLFDRISGPPFGLSLVVTATKLSD